MNEIDWEGLVADAKAAKPEQLLIRLQRWGDAFERTERRRLLTFTPAEKIAAGDVSPVIADYPEPVRAFFLWLASAFRDGRPCRDERELFAAKKAWMKAVYKETYDAQVLWLQISRDTGIPFNGEVLGRGDTPSESALEAIAATSDVKTERLRDIIFPRRKKPPHIPM